jgi:Zn-dependent protease
MEIQMTKKKNSWGWLLASAVFLGTKLKWIVTILKFAKFATLISLFISLGAYAWFYGWKFAGVLVYLIYLHEMGHLIAAKHKGVKTSKAIFIPFVGALISLKEKPKDAKVEAYLAYGGPLLGTIAFLPAIPLYLMTNNPIWGLVITVGSLLNLFNLFPVSPLDGGRIVTVLSTKIWGLGLLGLIAYVVIFPSPMISIILIFGLLTWWERVRESYLLKKLVMKNQLMEQYTREIETVGLATYDELSNKRDENKMQLKGMRKFYFPIFEDSKKLKKIVLNFELSLIDLRISCVLLDSSVEIGIFSPAKVFTDTLEKMIGNNQEEIQKMKSYYKTDMKTKVKWLVLYLGLALVLAICLVYGTSIMDLHKEILNK